MVSILVEEVETKRSYSFIFLVNAPSYASMLLPENSLFLLTFDTTLFKLQSKGFILAELKIDTILRKKTPHLFSHILGSCKILCMLLMTFLCTSDSTILGEYFNWLPEPQIFLNASYSCVPLQNVAGTVIQRIFSSLPAGLCICINVEWIFLLLLYGISSKLFSHLFTTAFHTSSFKEIQELKKHWVATSCPSGIDHAGRKCLWGTWSRVWLQETQIVPKLHRAQLMLTRISTKWVHSVQAH